MNYYANPFNLMARVFGWDRRMKNDGPLVQVDAERADEPSTQMAYEWAEKSHDWMVGRILSQNDRVSRILTFTATLSIAAPGLIQDDFGSPFFIEAMVLFFVLILYGVRGQHQDTIRLPKIGCLRANVNLQPEVFRRGVLYTAEKNWRHNVALLDRVAERADKMTVLLVLETICLVLWIVWP